jgi:hypothetical protein
MYTAAEVAVIRQRLVAFYEQHAPERVNNVDTLLEHFRGREDELVRKVASKYGYGQSTDTTTV